MNDYITSTLFPIENKRAPEHAQPTQLELQSPPVAGLGSDSPYE